MWVNIMLLKELISPCGLDCFNCPLFHSKNNNELKEKISQNMNIPLETCFCEGCRIEEGKISAFDFKETCPIYECTKNKDIEFCYECDDFPCKLLQPCADMSNLVPHNLKIYNLALIKKIGIEEWSKKAKDIRKSYFKDKFYLLNH